MLQPHLQDISPNDFGDWQAFCDANHDSRNAHAWFLLTIGLQGFEGTTLFQVLVATPAALASATGNDRSRRVLVVETFTPDLIEDCLLYTSDAADE